ncbi:unnamed protein product [Microthlaspi erraticum]|uniref:F-box domain-containing protein n=1 Tax=Microthlaspi erraticum TaxID=1685480 RepID=A0A6D2K9P1_9BRAS|nr:unnamed protein product [Microthlaspi erraticum]
MSTISTGASNTNEPPSFFSSLPNDLVLNVLACVPRRYYPILTCVSKKFRSLVRSSELHETRSRLGKNSFYVCFREYDEDDGPSSTYHWFSLIENRLVSVPFPSQPDPYSAALMVGPEIYFVGGHISHVSISSSMWILDSRSGKLREGPNTLVARRFTGAGLVDDKIYLFGGHDKEDEEIQAEVFDTKTQTWDVAPNPKMKREWLRMSGISPSLDRKIYARNVTGQVIVYDPRDGTCEKIDVPNNDDGHCSKDVVVIENVLYIFKSSFGLMWYDSKEKVWRVVNGLKLGKRSASKVAMAEYNGKLAFLWHDRMKKEIWCVMITLERSGVEITGKVEWFGRVLSVPDDYRIMHCLNEG